MIHASHRIRLSPNAGQLQVFRQMAGARRWAYNWGLERWRQRYEAGEKVSDNELRKELTQLKRESLDHRWLTEVPQAVTANALRDLGVAFKNFFANVKSGRKPGYPNFKKRGLGEGFKPTDRTGQLRINGKRIYIRGVGWVRLTEQPRFAGKCLSFTVSKDSDGHWYASLAFELDSPPVKLRIGSGDVGIDLGVGTVAVLSDGEEFTFERRDMKQDKRMKRLQRKLARQVKGSNSRTRTKARIARLHARARRVRTARIHEFTTEVVRSFTRIAIEDLNVKGMTKLRSLARKLGESCLGEIRRQLTYKSQWYDSHLLVVSRWFPSSKLCSACGNKKADLKLSDRMYRCESCKREIDRDINAAINLKKQLPVLGREVTPAESSLAGVSLSAD